MTEQAKRTGRRWLLIGSLGLNLFLIGFMAIGVARHHWGDTADLCIDFSESDRLSIVR